MALNSQRYLVVSVESLQSSVSWKKKDHGGRDKNLALEKERSCLNLLKVFYFYLNLQTMTFTTTTKEQLINLL